MRRIFLPALSVGEIELPDSQAHHLRDVLRLTEGEQIEAFDETGLRGHGSIVSISRAGVRVSISKLEWGDADRVSLTVASALPKGQRADWMIEKLSELGVGVFVPLITERSVVLAKGEGKSSRWKRLAVEAAEQSGRTGVMQIEPPMKLGRMLDQLKDRAAWHLSTGAKAKPMLEMVSSLPEELVLLVGPEGGWTDQEIAAFESRGIVGVRLTGTVLRVETAAVAAAAIVQSA